MTASDRPEASPYDDTIAPAADPNEASAPPEGTLEKVQAEIAELKDAWLRARAETENVRRQGQADVARAHKYAIETFAKELLAVRDALEQTLAADASVSVETLKTGADLTLKSLDAAFARAQIAEVNPVGEKFDPHRHQAMQAVPSDLPPNTVVSVLQKGYLLNDRVLGRERSNVKKVEASVDEGAMKQKGVMHKGLDLPFKTKSEISATADGRIRVHTRSVKLGFLPVKPIMKLFSIEMDDMVKIKPGHGATVQDNDILLDPGQMLPPPRMNGRLRRVWLEDNESRPTTRASRIARSGPSATCSFTISSIALNSGSGIER